MAGQLRHQTAKILLTIGSVPFYLFTTVGWVTLGVMGFRWLGDGIKPSKREALIYAAMTLIGTIGLRMIDAGRKALDKDRPIERHERSRV